jgi:hypothetical protein
MDVARYRYSWAASATKHGIIRARTRYVIEHCGTPVVVPPEPPDRPAERLLFLGDDNQGVALEVLGVELLNGDLRVIHSMPMRPIYRSLYMQAKQWRI